MRRAVIWILRLAGVAIVLPIVGVFSLGLMVSSQFGGVDVNSLFYCCGFHALACLSVVPWLIPTKAPAMRGYCEECGYCLRGNVSGTCPECGCATKSLGKEECEVGP